jgi:hypothetical protein
MPCRKEVFGPLIGCAECKACQLSGFFTSTYRQR